jgi:hypothetical protein
MMRYLVYNRNYDEDYNWQNNAWQRVPLSDPYPEDEKWVVEAVDGQQEFHYATHEDAINSIYEGSH